MGQSHWIHTLGSFICSSVEFYFSFVCFIQIGFRYTHITIIWLFYKVSMRLKISINTRFFQYIPIMIHLIAVLNVEMAWDQVFHQGKIVQQSFFIWSSFQTDSIESTTANRMAPKELNKILEIFFGRTSYSQMPVRWQLYPQTS